MVMLSVMTMLEISYSTLSYFDSSLAVLSQASLIFNGLKAAKLDTHMDILIRREELFA